MNIRTVLQPAFCRSVIFYALISIMLVSSLVSTAAAEASNKAALIKLLQGYQQECTDMQELDIDAEDLSKPPVGKLTLDPSNIYDLQIHTSGTTATVLYPNFHCENYGFPYCGTGGCGFYLIVDGKVFHRSGGFKPHVVTLTNDYGSTTVVVFGIHGGGCDTAEGSTGSGADPCYRTATWSDGRQTFFSDEDVQSLQR